MREVAAALTGPSSAHFQSDPAVYLRDIGLKLAKAYTYLGDVKEHKQIIPFRRFAGGVGRASQAKQFKATQGACYYPQGLVRVLTSTRSVARKIRQIHHASAEERRIECRREKH
jgi:large subunit ribosomal protein L17e